MEDVALGEPIGRVKANDLDIGENAKSSYDIIEGDGMDIFEITTDAQTQDGIIRVRKVNISVKKKKKCFLYIQLPSQTVLCEKILDFQGFFYLWMRCQASEVIKKGCISHVSQNCYLGDNWGDIHGSILGAGNVLIYLGFHVVKSYRFCFLGSKGEE